MLVRDLFRFEVMAYNLPFLYKRRIQEGKIWQGQAGDLSCAPLLSLK